MKKLLCSILAIGILFSMVGCGPSKEEKEKQAQEEKDKEKYKELKKDVNAKAVPEGANEEETTIFNTKKDEILKMIKDKKSFTKIDEAIEELDKLELDINVRIALDKEKQETESQEQTQQQDNTQQVDQSQQTDNTNNQNNKNNDPVQDNIQVDVNLPDDTNDTDMPQPSSDVDENSDYNSGN